MPQPEIARVAQDAVGGPLAELDLGHELGPHPPRDPSDGPRRRWVERRLVDRALGQQRAEPVELGGAEAGADLAREAQLAVVVVADEQAAEASGPPALA